MSKTKTPRYTTPTGTAIYPWLNKPDTKFNPDGEFKLKLAVPGETAQKTVTFLDEQFEQSVAKAKKDNPGKKIKVGNAPYEINEETGEVVLSFKLKHKVQKKDGTTFEQYPALFDAKLKPMTDEIGGGSTLKVSYEVVPYYTAMAGAGLSLRVRAVQVLELKQFGGAGAGAYGFGEEDGYEAEESAAEKNGFTSEESDETDF